MFLGSGRKQNLGAGWVEAWTDCHWPQQLLKLGPEGHGRKLSLATGCRFDYSEEKLEAGEQPGSHFDSGCAVIGVGPRWGQQRKERRLDT